MSWLFAVLHLLALAIGLPAIWIRARALGAVGRGGSLAPVFTADALWILALGLWLGTGLVRALAGLEMPAGDYARNGLFWTKMAVFALVFVVELWPMTVLLQWGFQTERGRTADLRAAPGLAVLSYAQALLVVAAAALAAAVARGHGET